MALPPVRHVEATQAGISDGAAEMPQSSFFLAPLLDKCTWLPSFWPKSIIVLALRRSKMLIEAALFLSFVIAAGAIIVKAYEWRQDVLHGPYIKRNDWNK